MKRTTPTYAWETTLVLTGIILWLTLAAQPVPEDTPVPFDGFDKLAHALMFGAWAAALIFDWWFVTGRAGRLALRAAIGGLASALFGAGMEVMQGLMGLGRSADVYDAVADAVGAVAAAVLAYAIIGHATARK